ncbi:hypothetical protein [Candidatus Contubernalis alkaliaceticus]|uniref:hypothetical protein n=1 Tax=Candidatus Contubernalis alkaliaceticus TaxID=338645 RepID=UPI001F4BEC78|nr:hypothetical protein [Candidatus Contubernalis alkalaceticus]UNC91642.1 hypothetical protein HUE98_05780 [Candidatus Contubernalis alkalaceticus]
MIIAKDSPKLEETSVETPAIVSNPSSDFPIRAFIIVPPNSTAETNIYPNTYYNEKKISEKKTSTQFTTSSFLEYNEKAGIKNAFSEYFLSSIVKENIMMKKKIKLFSLTPYLSFIVISTFGIAIFLVSLFLSLFKDILLFHPYYILTGLIASMGLFVTVIIAYKYNKENIFNE